MKTDRWKLLHSLRDRSWDHQTGEHHNLPRHPLRLVLWERREIAPGQYDFTIATREVQVLRVNADCGEDWFEIVAVDAATGEPVTYHAAAMETDPEMGIYETRILTPVWNQVKAIIDLAPEQTAFFIAHPNGIWLNHAPLQEV